MTTLQTRVCQAVAAAWLAGAASISTAATPEEEIAQQAPAARAILDAWQAKDPERAERRLHLVYWTPADREPQPRHRERLSAILEETRDFLARELERNGLGRRELRLDREADGLCRVHLVRGAGPHAEYNVGSGGKIRGECVPVLRAAGLDPDRETIALFCNMANWDPEKRVMSQNSPYYAAGNHRAGTAWQVDSPLLDLELLTVREPPLHDGQYGRISPGRYNSIFIGGVIHELGHAFGLPHNRERPDQAERWGTALMGSGNRTYGEERRGSGRGTFLTLGEALRLASHPAFCGSVKGLHQDGNARLHDIRIEPQGGSFRFSARVEADPPAYAVIGYLDPAGGSNYDATTATAVPDADGRFTLDCRALRPGKNAILHVVVAQANGAMSSYNSFGGEPRFPYAVDADGTVDLTAAIGQVSLAPLVRAVNRGDRPAADAALAALGAEGSSAPILEAARVLLGTMDFKPGPAPSLAEGRVCLLSEAAAAESSVGYGRAVANRLPGDDALLLAGGRLHARGLYAHAPARHRWALDGKWERLTGIAALADGREGSVAMRILADGQQIWKSPRLADGATARFDLPVKGVASLELLADDAGDGNRSDWALWLDPTLHRQGSD